jgi:hypothetical protein
MRTPMSKTFRLVRIWMPRLTAFLSESTLSFQRASVSLNYAFENHTSGKGNVGHLLRRDLNLLDIEIHVAMPTVRYLHSENSSNPFSNPFGHMLTALIPILDNPENIN